MKFKCEQCNAQYAIADEKVGKKGVRVRCKKCGHIITVRPGAEVGGSVAQQDPGAAALQPEPARVQSTGSEELPGGSSRLDSNDPADSALSAGGDGKPDSPPRAEDEVGNAFANLFGEEGLAGGEDGSEDRPESDREATRLFSMQEMQRIQSEKAALTGGVPLASQPSSGTAGRKGTSPEPDRDRVEWYVAVNDQQLGPMSMAEVSERLDKNEIDHETLAWKSGLDDWAPLAEIPEIRFLVEGKAGGQAEEESEALLPDRTGVSASGAGFDDEGDHDREDQFENDERFTAQPAEATPAEVEWKPTALAELSSLAQEELAGLRPAESEPLPEEASESGDNGDLAGAAEASESASADEGDSSIIAQIAAEEEAVAKRAEEKRREEEQMAAQEAARREQYEEQREKMVPPTAVEKYLPARATVPGWLIGVLSAGGLVVITLLGFIAYKLASTSVSDTTPVVPAPPAGQVPAMANQPQGVSVGRSAVAPSQPEGVATQSPATVVAAAPTSPAVPPSGVPPSVPAAAVSASDTPPTLASGASRQPSADAKSVQRKKAGSREQTGPRVPPVQKAEAAERQPPPAEEKKAAPPRRGGTGDLLDFDDRDSKALDREVGGGTPVAAVAPKVEEPKDLPPLSNADVMLVMRQRKAEFEACARKQKEVDDSVKGKIVVEFFINPDGSVSKIATTTPQFQGTFVSSCISKVIQGLRFPKSGGPSKRVPFPFNVN